MTLITKPEPLPAQALDHSAGYLMASGIIAALVRQISQGQSWHVGVSLAQCGHWLRSLGRIHEGFAPADPGYDQVADVMEDSASGFGTLRAVSHSARRILGRTQRAARLPPCGMA